jgi:hypothetical protein
MRLMNGISIFITQLLNDLFDLIVILCSGKITYDALEPERMLLCVHGSNAPEGHTQVLRPFSYRTACRSRLSGY